MTLYTIYSGTGDGTIYSSNATYATARSGSGLYADTADTIIYVGQASFGSFQCNEGFISFNTSSVAGNVSSATLYLNKYSFQTPGTNYTLRARRLDWGTLTTADWIAGASVSGQTLLASLSTASFVDDTYVALTSDGAFITNINQSGTTGIILTSSLFEAGTSPSGDDQIGIFSGDESGTTKDPKLEVNATLPTSRPVPRRALRIWNKR